jgi:hypothetical protein
VVPLCRQLVIIRSNCNASRLAAYHKLTVKLQRLRKALFYNLRFWAPFILMKVFVKDARLRRHSVDVDDGASVAHLKLLLANMSLVPAGFVPNLVYQTRNPNDGDCVGGIGYSPDLSISLVCVRAAPACAAADCKPHSSRPSDANPPAAAQTAPASPAADAGGAAAQAAAGPLTEPPFSSSAASPCAPLAHPSSAAVREGSRVRIEGLQTKPEMNGRRGVVRGGFNVQSGRWTVEVAAEMRLVPLVSVPFAQPTFV